jgi:hypothetical protein
MGTTMNDSALWDDYGYHHDDLDEPKSLVPVSFPGADTAPDGSRGQAPPGDDTPTAGA